MWICRSVGLGEVSLPRFMWSTQFIGKFHATDVQHTCNTTCNTTTLPVNLQSKCLSGTFRRPKAISKGKGENFAPSRENHRNLQPKCSCCTSCCTCVASVLHVGCMCFLAYFLWGQTSPWLAPRFGSLVWNFRGRRKILSGKRNTFEAGARF